MKPKACDEGMRRGGGSRGVDPISLGIGVERTKMTKIEQKAEQSNGTNQTVLALHHAMLHHLTF